MIFGFFRMVFYAILVYILYKFIMRILSPATGGGRPARDDGHSGIMVKDEVCNTYLSRDEAIRVKVGGVDCYFCSEDCRNRFLAEKKAGTGNADRTSA